MINLQALLRIVSISLSVIHPSLAEQAVAVAPKISIFFYTWIVLRAPWKIWWVNWTHLYKMFAKSLGLWVRVPLLNPNPSCSLICLGKLLTPVGLRFFIWEFICSIKRHLFNDYYMSCYMSIAGNTVVITADKYVCPWGACILQG